MRAFFVEQLKRNAYFILAAAWLFTIAFIVSKYGQGTRTPAGIAKRMSIRVSKEVNDFEARVKDTASLQLIFQGKYGWDALQRLVKLPYHFLVYKVREGQAPRLIFWNRQEVLPSNDFWRRESKASVVKLSNGHYYQESKRVFYQQESYELLMLLPVEYSYFIENSNLRKQFPDFPGVEKRVRFSAYVSDYPVQLPNGQALYYLEPLENPGHLPNQPLVVLLTLLGILFLLLGIHNIAIAFSHAYGYVRGIAFLTGSVLLLRLSTYWFPGWFNTPQYTLFDPAIYHANFINRSLGDLLINAFLVFWLVVFIRRETRGKEHSWAGSLKWKWPVVVGAALALVLVTFIYGAITRSLIADAQISFNVTNFFSLDRYSFAGFLALATLSISFFLFSRWVLHVVRLWQQPFYYFYIVLAVVGLLLLTLTRNAQLIQPGLWMLAWLLLYAWIAPLEIVGAFKENLNVSQVMFWIFFFSLSVSGIIISENNQIELEQRKRTAERLSLQADPSSERLLSIALTYIDNDFLLGNIERFRLPASNAYLKDSIANKNFSAYLNKYDTRLYTFDANEKALYNPESISFDTLNTIFTIEGKSTNVPDLRYFENNFDKFTYIAKKTIIDSLQEVQGYLFVLAEPKQYKSDALVPELFKQRKDFLPNEYAPIYSYAIYNGGDLLFHYSDYPFPTKIDQRTLPVHEFTRKRQGGYDEIWYRNANKLVVIAKKSDAFLEAVTLFAYLFTTFLLLVTLFQIIAFLVQSGLRWQRLRTFWQLNLRSQIHATIIFVSLFSFVVIGIATIIFFINRYDKNKQDRLSKSIQAVAKDWQTQLPSQASLLEAVRQYETGTNNELAEIASRIAEVHEADINLYNTQGNLIISSNPFIYEKGILSTRMHPIAFYYLNRQRLVQYVNDEQMGEVKYQSVYCPLRDTKGNAYAYLNIPSFDAQSDLKREISNFLVTIINLNAFIFLIAGIIALMITNRVTSYFALIGDKMKEISLGKLNEEIDWKREDEIGGLVKEYNKMVHKLEASAAALAKSEREGAWREMARQVAHEIKNPLTPMKLSIQYLQKAVDSGSGDVKALSANVARTLVEQIDHLSKIASDFSQFANIGNVRNERFDLHEVIHSLQLLYQSTDNLQVEWKALPQRLMVVADKTQLNRLFTNLLQNAVQSTEGAENPSIWVDEQRQGLEVVISVRDNGMGIPPAIQDKIFMPNFTTKSSGTGLGLAMSKSIVEQAQGRIWFETAQGVGTVFYVALPISCDEPVADRPPVQRD